MPLTHDQKAKIISELEEKIGKASSLIFTDFTGLSMAKMREFRQALKKLNATLQVAKKTLIKRALKRTDADSAVGGQSKTPVSVIFGSGDIIELAKAAYVFSKTQSMKILGGIMDKRFMSAQEMIAVAKLPTKPQLLSMLLRTIQAPVTNLAGVLNANLRNLVCALDAIKNKKQ